jgi:hypothetical protein
MSTENRQRTMLDHVFTVARAMQALCLICVIGMTANFVSEMVMAEQRPMGELVGMLVVVGSSIFLDSGSLLIYS